MNLIMQQELLFADFISYKTAASTSNQTPIYVQEDNMNTNTTDNETTARRALRDDVSHHFAQHDRKLMRHFHIMDDEDPETPETAIERIKSGMYDLKDKKDRNLFSHWTHNIRWRDPSHEKDADGYKAAETKLRTAYKHTQQDVLCDPLDKAKASVRKFEDATFH